MEMPVQPALPPDSISIWGTASLRRPATLRRTAFRRFDYPSNRGYETQPLNRQLPYYFTVNEGQPYHFEYPPNRQASRFETPPKCNVEATKRNHQVDPQHTIPLAMSDSHVALSIRMIDEVSRILNLRPKSLLRRDRDAARARPDQDAIKSGRTTAWRRAR